MECPRLPPYTSTRHVHTNTIIYLLYLTFFFFLNLPHAHHDSRLVTQNASKFEFLLSELTVIKEREFDMSSR